MYRLLVAVSLCILPALLAFSCGSGGEKKAEFTGEPGEVVLMTVDPGHFHAGLLQKVMYGQVSDTAYVYAPEGPDVVDHLARIQSFNTRDENPTHWVEQVYTGDDFFEKMLEERPGNVAVFSGNNRRKTEFINRSVEAGLNVYSDKPMCIDRNGFELLKQAFAAAKANNVLLYDVMTERHEITTIIQKELAHTPSVFGELKPGTPDDPSVTKESVHHLFKYVAGSPLTRPAWFFDVTQQGEGLVDIGTHLVDLVQWECFPEEIIDIDSDIRMISARRWPTMMTREQFGRVTKLLDFPDYLKPLLDDNGVLPYYCNGEAVYTLKGIHAKVSVIWNYEAPEGGGDTHYSIMKGTRANVIIRQGAEQNYRPELYVEAADGVEAAPVGDALLAAVSGMQSKWPGIAAEETGGGWHVTIPDTYRIGHEAHFGQVTEKYLQYLVDGKLPDWEVPNMIAKYHTTTAAYELSHKSE